MTLIIDGRTSDTIKTVNDLISVNSTPVQIANAVRDAAENNSPVSPTITAIDTMDSLVSLVKKVPLLGETVAGAAFLNDYFGARNDLNTNGYVTDRSWLALASSTAAVIALLPSLGAVGLGEKTRVRS